MKGFELKYNDRTVVASVENGVTSIILSKHLHFGGLDTDANQHINWFESIVNNGDEIRVKVVDVKESSEIIQIRSRVPKDKLDEYNRLKKYLEKEGII